MKLIFVLTSFLLINYISAQQTIAVHFCMAPNQQRDLRMRKNGFGGLKGGPRNHRKRVIVLLDSTKGNCHVFGQKENANGYFKVNKNNNGRRYSFIKYLL